MNESQSDTKISIEDKSQVERCLKVEISREAFDKRYNSMLARTASQAHLKGFRPGRAPRAMVAKLYGAELQGKAFDEMLSPVLSDTIKENQWRVIGNPTLDDLSLKDGMPVEATVRVYLYPEAKIEKWEGIEVDVEIEEFRPEDVEHQLLHLRERAGSLVDVTDRQLVQLNDYAVVRFTMSLDGVVKQKTEEEPWMIHISNSPEQSDDISSHLLGRNVGDKFTFTHKFSSDYNQAPEFAGQEVLYDMELIGIKLMELHELNEEFLKKIKFEGTMDDLLRDMTEREQQRITVANSQAKESAVFAKLIELNPVEIPEPMIEYQSERMLQEIGVGGKEKQISPEELKRFLPYVRGGAVFRASRGVLLQKIIDVNQWKLSEEEFDTWISGKAAEAQVSAEIFRSFMNKQISDGSLMAAALSEDAVRRIVESAVFNEKVREHAVCSTHGA